MMRIDVGRMSVAALRRLFLEQRQPVNRYRVQQLQADPRMGVRLLAAALDRRLVRQRFERRRLNSLLSFETCLWKRGTTHVAGVDEAGVGPLAGPVVAAAVVLQPGRPIPGVDDSKKLDPQTRAGLELSIRQTALSVEIGEANVEEIDRLNIYHAALLAMRRAVAALEPAPQQVLVDGRTIPDLDVEQQSIVGGDGRSLSIAAASIIAKTHRDRLMVELHRRYPEYGFDRHKGYCTTEHQRALQRHGVCPAHRHSFRFLREATGLYSESFYGLRGELAVICSASELRRVRQRLEAERGALSDEETQKLRLLLNRRRKRLGVGA